MLTVDKIKQYCIETDMANINAGCTSVGTFIYGKFDHIWNFQENWSLKGQPAP